MNSKGGDSMKRIVLCLDGTWNQVGKGNLPTNVVRIAQSVADQGDDGVPQIVYYNAGVGTDGPVDRFLGGVFGVGLRRNVQRAYAFCALNYCKGDEIYIFGFSRGAYTARAVAGIINKVGLVRPAHFERFDEVWNSYRSKKDRLAGNMPPAEIDQLADTTVPVRCVGVWDTVGSYGIPSGFGLGGLARLFTRRTLRFSDTGLGKNVEVALHAIAVDERRRPFAPTFWTKKKTKALKEGKVCEQVWFMGAHSNVGGSYADHALSDVALIWMMARVEETTNLRFDLEALEGKVTPNVSAMPINSTAWFYLVSRLRPLHRKLMNPCATDVGVFWDKRDESRENINERVHWSVVNRYTVAAQPLYRPRGYPADFKQDWLARVSERERQLWGTFGVPFPQ
ncbi:hypothetical protein RSO01_67700 [Reyranella soli]|uniref:T6SS Phospholipase effector Tle1-like catalytic domain-containing protein n=2 Tax=Reyranella soli TaxID=1230389 RepID=A0A512NKY3_9HYPH|nr:hypothetical protein RSO01_67700 [Reyranella soli]